MITIKEIKNKYNHKPFIIYDESNHQNIWDLEWSFEWVLNNKFKWEKIIVIKSMFGWYEQVIDQLDEIRYKIKNDFNYDVIPLDYDWCGCYDLWKNNTLKFICPRNLNKIRSIFKKHNIRFKYIICGNNGTLGLLKTNKINNNCIKYLNKFLIKRNNNYFQLIDDYIEPFQFYKHPYNFDVKKIYNLINETIKH